MARISEFRHAVAIRLKKVRQALGFSQEKMGVIFDTQRTAYTKKELGQTLPTQEQLHMLATEYDISLDWLLAGKGRMRFSEMRETTAEERLKAKTRPASAVESSVRVVEIVFSAEPEKNDDRRPIYEEYRRLLEQMEQIPQLRYEVLSYFYRFKNEHPDLG